MSNTKTTPPPPYKVNDHPTINDQEPRRVAFDVNKLVDKLKLRNNSSYRRGYDDASKSCSLKWLEPEDYTYCLSKALIAYPNQSKASYDMYKKGYKDRLFEIVDRELKRYFIGGYRHGLEGDFAILGRYLFLSKDLPLDRYGRIDDIFRYIFNIGVSWAMKDKKEGKQQHSYGEVRKNSVIHKRIVDRIVDELLANAIGEKYMIPSQPGHGGTRMK
jgi:hypothetical protein